MGRRAEGWRLREKAGSWYVRFTWNNRRYEVSTGESDRGKAEKRAAKIYGDIVNGRSHREGLGVARGLELSELVASWLDQHPVRDNTRECYMGYAREYISKFGELDQMTGDAISSWGRELLAQHTRKTTTKKLHVLRAFLQWCKEQRYLSEVPKFDLPPKKALGKKAAMRKEMWTILSEEEAVAIINALPESSRYRPAYPVRSFFVFLWETGLRESTVSKLEYGRHYREGFGNKLFISADIDKAGFERWVPLTDAALWALRGAVCAGDNNKFIWGEHDHRKAIAKACASCGIDPAKAANFSPYDLRHSRATQLADRGALTGLAYLLGHRQLSTTNVYMHPQENEAAKLLEEKMSVSPGGFEPPTSRPPVERSNQAELRADKEENARNRWLEYCTRKGGP